MDKKLRAQLRRHKARPRSSNKFWSHVSGINVPWTVGQRKWVQGKVRDGIKTIFTAMASNPRPDRIIMSAEMYQAFRSDITDQEVN